MKILLNILNLDEKSENMISTDLTKADIPLLGTGDIISIEGKNYGIRSKSIYFCNSGKSKKVDYITLNVKSLN